MNKPLFVEVLSCLSSIHSGRVETFTDLPINRYITIVEGLGLK